MHFLSCSFARSKRWGLRSNHSCRFVANWGSVSGRSTFQTLPFLRRGASIISSLEWVNFAVQGWISAAALDWWIVEKMAMMFFDRWDKFNRCLCCRCHEWHSFSDLIICYRNWVWFCWWDCTWKHCGLIRRARNIMFLSFVVRDCHISLLLYLHFLLLKVAGFKPYRCELSDIFE